VESELVALASATGPGKGFLEIWKSGVEVASAIGARSRERSPKRRTFAQRVRYRRRQDDVVVDKQVACGRLAVSGHALAEDLVDVTWLSDTRPRKVDVVAVKVW